MAFDAMEEHFLEANERMGEALVQIGMALGLPRPGAQVQWGAPEILARVQQLRAQLSEYQRTMTTGGPRVPFNEPGRWRNVSLAPPPSANDPGAPRLRRDDRKGGDAG